MSSELTIATDARWTDGGIGRYSTEVLSRIPFHIVRLTPPYSLFSPRAQVWLARKLRQGLADVYFTPGVNPPLLSPIPTVFVVHDLIPLRFADESGWRKRLFFRTIVRLAARRSDCVLTVSEFSRREIVTCLGIAPDRVRVAHNGVGPQFSPAPDGSDKPGRERDAPYILYVGNKRPHKNLDLAVQAFARSGIANRHTFILSGEPDPHLLDVAEAWGVTDCLQFTGSVDEDRLVELYRGATVLLFPSRYEGFGLPVLEAMACGTPVVTSNVSALPEVAGDAALLVDPSDAAEMATALRRLVEDKGLRCSLRRDGLERARSFSWEHAARAVTEALRDAAPANRGRGP